VLLLISRRGQQESLASALMGESVARKLLWLASTLRTSGHQGAPHSAELPTRHQHARPVTSHSRLQWSRRRHNRQLNCPRRLTGAGSAGANTRRGIARAAGRWNAHRIPSPGAVGTGTVALVTQGLLLFRQFLRDAHQGDLIKQRSCRGGVYPFSPWGNEFCIWEVSTGQLIHTLGRSWLQ